MKEFHKQILRVITDRLFIASVFVIGLFAIIIFRVYDLQIIHHDEYDTNIRETIRREIETDAPRGLIFDKYGRPLAINQPTYILNVDQGIRMSNEDLNDMLLRLAELLESNGDDYVDNIPITIKEPFEYRFAESSKKQFINSIPHKNDKEKDKAHKFTAQELFDYLKSETLFDIDPLIPENDARKIAALRYELYKTSWSKYKLITVATDVSMETISTVEEQNNEYRGVTADVKSVRYYPEGELFAHILGYTRQITEAQFEQMEEEGYEKEDIVGQMGLEQSQEDQLRGIKGSEIVEVDNRGRKVRTVEKKDEVPGNNFFITMDSKYQKATYDILENQLTNIILQRLRGGKGHIEPISGKEVIYSVVESNTLSFTKMQKAAEGTVQYTINKNIVEEFEQIDDFQKEKITPKALLLQWLDEKSADLITDRQVVLMLHEQGVLSLSEETITNFKNNKHGNVTSVLIQQMEKGILKPKHMAIDPFSAAALVVDVENGEVLSMIGYPSYDPNELITNFNEFYPLLADNSDKRRLLIDRAMRTAKAPGSTFKMISAIAGMEKGTINENTTVFCTGTYTKAGTPHAKCTGRHGNVDLRRAIEVSCNYYFYQIGFNLGQGDPTPYSNINRLTTYVEMFGLGEKSGIELLEAEPLISSPKVVATKGLSAVLWNMINMEGEKRGDYTEAVIQRISKVYIPWADTSDLSLDSKVQKEIQHELKRNMEPAIGTALEPILPALINEIIISLESTIAAKRHEIVASVVENVMNDPSHNLSLKNKSKKYLVDEIGGGIKAIASPIIGQALMPIMDTELVDAYNHAYTVAYGRLRRSSDAELVQALKYGMENTQIQVASASDKITEDIATSIVSHVIDQIIEKANLGWNEGITIRTAIGQGNSAFTPVQVAKYVAALANREHVYDLRVIDAVQDSKGNNQIVEKETVIKNSLDVSQKTMDAVHEGMLRVSRGTQGTARSVYQDFVIPVASKTGTAQEGGKEHSWFVGFAPYDEPEVAIVTVIYNSNGAGRYGLEMSREILEAYFELDKEYEQTTIDNIFTR